MNRIQMCIGAGILLLTGCSENESPAVVVTARPLVTLLARIVGPTAAEKDQWLEQSRTISTPIPDDRIVGVRHPGLEITTNLASSCNEIHGVGVSVGVAHPRPLDLVITLSTVSATGTILRTATLWDGPGAIRADPVKAAKERFTGDFDASKLMSSSDCTKWRLSVEDHAPGQAGTLLRWTLKRRVALYAFAHADKNYYRRLLFGAGGQTPNVQGYFREVSRQKFAFTDAGIFGPSAVARDKWYGLTDEQRVGNLTRIIEDAGFDFGRYDRNRNGRIDNEELGILAVLNDSTVGGMNRSQDGGCATLQRSPLQVCSLMAFVGQQVPFDVLTHELSHSLGTQDLYGRWNEGDSFSAGLTLMSGSSDKLDGMDSLYLDSWHRKALGWYVPYAARFPYEMGDETWSSSWGQKSRPAIIHNPRNLNEYYLFEYRGKRGYDAGASDFGVVAWHIQEDGAGNPIAGEFGYANGVHAVGPDSDFGAHRAWSSADGAFMLPWNDKTLLPFSFRVEEPRNSASSAILDFENVPVGHLPPRIRIVQPANGASVNRGWIAFEAADQGSTGPLRIWWDSSSDGFLGEGLKLSPLITVPGPRTITVSVRDRYGAKGSDSITLNLEYTRPTAEIYAPAAGATVFRNQPVRLWGKGTTPGYFSVSCEWLTWSIDRLPSWSMTSQGNSGQCEDVAAFDLTGPATIRLTVLDKDAVPRSGAPIPVGAFTTTVSVPVTFIDPPAGAPPIVTITAPQSGRLMADQVHRVSGVVSDPGGGAVTYRWTVFEARTSTETQIATVPSFDWRPDTAVRGGSVELRLYGTNTRGQTAMARQNTFVEPPPW